MPKHFHSHNVSPDPDSKQISEAVAAGLPIKVVLINYTRMGVPFTNYLTLEPLCLGPLSPGPTHYVGTLCASPCHEAPSALTRLSAHFGCMSMGAHASAKANDACGEQPLACRQIVEDLLAANGAAPVSLPQLVRSPAHSYLPTPLSSAAAPRLDTTRRPRSAARDGLRAPFRDGHGFGRAGRLAAPRRGATQHGRVRRGTAHPAWGARHRHRHHHHP